MIMAAFEGISQVHVEFGHGRRINKVVRKWSEEQTDLFAAVLSLRSKDGENSSWSLAEELENLALKKSSNEKFFREIQARLEDELIKIDQSYCDNGEEATFSVPQLRAKYKWLKREWKIIQSKLNYGLGSDEVKTPGWYKLLDPVFSVYQTVNKDENAERPSMVNLLENGSTSTHPDGHPDTHSATALNRPESFKTGNQVDERHQTLMNKTQNTDILKRGMSRIDSTAIVRVNNNTARPITRARSESATSESPPRKTMRLEDSKEKTNETEAEGFSPGIESNISRCACRSESDRYVEIIKYLLDAEERREKMFVAFQKEQAEATRQHELKMAQFYAQSLSQQQVLSQGLNQILQLLSKKDSKND